jgi:Coenzyme PQQ synthesis protein D (PqqD)
MKLAKNIAVSETGFLFNPSTGDSYACNTIAADIINLLKEGKEENEIRSFLTSKYEVSEIELEKDLQDFKMQLKESNLLQLS